MQEKVINTIPFVAIIGRPNVGKSTLFNRLVGKKLAITDSIPGSTRDIVEQEIFLGDRAILLADTGGRRERTDSHLETLAIERSYSIDQKADLLLFVVEAMELLAEDEQLIDYLRRYQDKVILIVNKCDSHERDFIANNYYQYGFKELIMISAEHGRNIDLLREALYQHLPPALPAPEEQTDETAPIRITILGKPNAGKSTLANQLSQSDRSLVSEVAGTTRDSVKSHFLFDGQPFEIIDTAGLRRKAKVNDPIEFYSTRRAEASIREADVVLLLIDAQEGLTDQDKKIADKIILEKKPFLFVLNKCDLLAEHHLYERHRGDRTKLAVQNLKDAFPILNYLAVVPIEASHNLGLDKLMKMVNTVHRQSLRKIDDTEFQRALLQWRGDLLHGSPYHKSHIRSIRQVGVQPPRFVVRVQGKAQPNYVRYLTNRIQKEFRFNLVPITVEVEHV
ncbi:ribosome biogenesis GTPase Der [Entomospira culicis]|uniref:GTPase Der n=1 Tax=Entomospira culicis TaxID=2719989 RepID=A0A968GIC4_9SPIO|nr:ribosome biogenesis GTPase Der [Entomospira culicis]NIZ19508.1 ribosome biogenesis GTPase Der [Entomospira culicis]NIZ69587.1 ribosome biogenesis GTPase Der [Entomospira culicis]WDI36698.1 ribosome biogenesis GTPase Der [Entomospira culicis]WDI38327.1 ribosome biogenesis GTPase Der [Entomospira culicis]